MARRFAGSERKPRFMQPEEFEDEAAVLLAEFGREHEPVTAPPVPIDDIVEEYLRITIEFRDLQSEFPEGDVLGAIYFDDRKIVIDQSLVPEDYPSMRGRYRFTLAHELGHWRLHRHLFLRNSGERSLLGDEANQPDHVFRSRNSDPKEFQANRFAAALLIPRELLKEAWNVHNGSMDVVYLDDLRQRKDEILRAEIQRRGSLTMNDETIDNAMFEHVCRPLAETFEVSAESMRIRLETLGFFKRRKEATLF